MIRVSLLAALLASFGHCQINQGTDLRLGLLAPGLGLKPVPGGHSNNQGPNFASLREERCICIPINQLCDPTTSQSLINNNPASFTLNKLDLRVINKVPKTPCSKDEQVCCLGGHIFNGRNPVDINAAVTVRSGCGAQSFDVSNNRNTAQAVFGEFPWMVIIQDRANKYLGGGAFVSQEFVVTAAHRIFNVNRNNIKVRLGEYNTDLKIDHPNYLHEDIPVSQVIIHPQFDPITLQNNVALLKLQRRVEIKAHINPVCLPEAGQLFQSQQCYVSGFGQDSFSGGSYQQILKKVDVEVIDPFRCQALLRNTRLGPTFNLDMNSFVCAGGELGKDACTGDGGSPLVCNRNGRWTLVGLVAWGINCAQANVPGVYVNVPSFVGFIHQYVR